MLESLRIKKAENGFTIECSSKIPVKRDKKKATEMSDKELVTGMNDYNWKEEQYIAEDKEELLKIISEKLGGKDEE